MVTLFRFIVVPSALVGLIAVGLVSSNSRKSERFPIAHSVQLPSSEETPCASNSCFDSHDENENAPGIMPNPDLAALMASESDISLRCRGVPVPEGVEITTAPQGKVIGAESNGNDQPESAVCSRLPVASTMESGPLPAELPPQQQEQFAEILKLRDRFGGVSQVFDDPGWVQRANAQFVMALQDEHARGQGNHLDAHQVPVPSTNQSSVNSPSPSVQVPGHASESHANNRPPMNYPNMQARVFPNQPMARQPMPASAANENFRGNVMPPPPTSGYGITPRPTNGEPDPRNWRTEVRFAPGPSWEQSPRNMSPQQRARDYSRRLDEIANQMEDDSLYESADDLRAISQSLRESARQSNPDRVHWNHEGNDRRNVEPHEQNGDRPNHPPADRGEDPPVTK
jgi:hypothetical protein